MSIQTPKITEPIPGYSVKQRIGVGGYGEVWSAEAPGGLSKAIKFVYGYFDDARASRELKALERIKQVRHPFLLSLERYEVVDGQLLIVTELADMSLKDRYEQAKCAGECGIPRDELLAYLRDAADALDYMSVNFSLQHLDIKPENLLLVGGRVKVADFGLVKNLHDVTASMMGGLTPVYAAPEAFDDRPSPYSDQYSLAILYQEMLTGILPFPGRTAAQLASQHLHARPRLLSLPPADQPVIARALSKEPQQRYPSCRALIDALINAGLESTQRAEPASPKIAISTRDTVALKSPTVKTNLISRSDSASRVDADNPGQASYQTHVFGAEDEQPLSDRFVPRRLLCEPIECEPAVDLPPLEVSDEPWTLRPTLFVGIGDTGARTLRRLRRKLRDRLGQTADVPAMRMLLLDTDTNSIARATQGDRATSLDIKETLALPLRDAHAYANNSRYILTWLSRRWLYNIPRSMQTEGRRPLGRLAMVDHSASVLSRLTDALAAIADEQSLKSSADSTGLPFAAGPRVYLIASTSGGAGGGMVLDVAYLLRRLLIERGGSADDLYAILTHSTDRNPEAGELALANTLACLGELQEYRTAGYPGELSYELPPLSPEDSNLPNLYFAHLGDDLHDEELEAATESLATYLYLDSATLAGNTLDRCRRQSGVPSENDIRTFGVAGVGKLASSFADIATDLLCQQVLANWSGCTSPTSKESSRAALFDPLEEKQVVASQSELAQLAAAHARQQQIDAGILRNQVSTLLEKQMGGSVSLVMEKLWLAATQRFKPGTLEHADYALRAITHLFGGLPDDAEANHAVPILRTALENEVQQFAEAKSSAIRDWILALVEQPFARLGGACAALDWYADYVRGMDAQCADLLRATQTDLQKIVRNLQAALHAAPGRSGTLLGVRRGAIPTIDADDIFAVVEYRVRELELRGVHKLLRILAATLSSVGDELKDLKSQLARLTREHFATCAWELLETEEAESGSTATGSMRARYLRQALPELARDVESYMQSWLETELGGLRRACAKSHSMVSEVLPLLKSQARAAIVNALKRRPTSEQLGAAENSDARSDESLQGCVNAARPALASCGGRQRLIAILPAGADESVRSALANQLQTPATFVAGCDSELVCCFEAEGVPVANVAAKLIDCRTDLIRVAARLHTRIDVNWSNLGESA